MNSSSIKVNSSDKASDWMALQVEPVVSNKLIKRSTRWTRVEHVVLYRCNHRVVVMASKQFKV